MREEPLTGDAAAIVTQFLAISTQIITLSNICHHQTQEIEYLANLAGVYCLEAFPQFFERSIAIGEVVGLRVQFTPNSVLQATILYMYI